MTDTYPPKPERSPTISARAIGWNNCLTTCEAHYDPQITALKARVAELKAALIESIPTAEGHDYEIPALAKLTAPTNPGANDE